MVVVSLMNTLVGCLVGCLVVICDEYYQFCCNQLVAIIGEIASEKNCEEDAVAAVA